MDTNMLFSIVLNLSSHWKVVKSEFRMPEGCSVRELHICIDFIHARVPRLKTDASSIEMVKVPWARSNSGFKMLYEAFAMALIEE